MTDYKQVIAAGAFIFNNEEKIFLAKFRNKFQEQWSIPGGKLQFGENPLEAVIREVKEETYLDIPDPEFFEAGSFVVNSTHVVYIDYIALVQNPVNVKLNDEFSEWGFFDIPSLDLLDIIPKTKSTALAAFRYLSKRKWSEKLSSYNLGLVRKTILLQEVQANWREAYQWVLSQVQELCSGSFECIGSTSIPGLISKPVLDLLLIFEDEPQFKKEISKLEQLGFSYKGDGIGKVTEETDSSRHFFSYYDEKDKVDYVHLHALPKGHPHVDNLLRFRDALRKDPRLVQEYRDLKLEFLRRALTRREYTRSKDEFVAKVLGK